MVQYLAYQPHRYRPCCLNQPKGDILTSTILNLDRRDLHLLAAKPYLQQRCHASALDQEEEEEEASRYDSVPPTTTTVALSVVLTAPTCDDLIYRLGLTGPHDTGMRVAGENTLVHTALSDWHQYDDIVCVKPPESVLPRFFTNLWKSQKNNILKGKELAAKEMLNNLFSMLNTWTPLNVKNFLKQLNQFYFVNKNPLVHETRPKAWEELQFGEKQVL
ncbi:hypothetical protein JD844_011403 [Phrynosoma platyrhinos]|uniref:Uncharacterized protein n=1 Tax=Phrynosoma platyrhinos TaxID=52577 RepID=A0ABQ7THX4_PHRPL|nr:hypothetical protein JD844_011403 [Phrynosoma platyrhinos]